MRGGRRAGQQRRPARRPTRKPALSPAREPSIKAIERLLEAKLPDGSSGTLVAALDGEMLVCQGWGLADREAEVSADCDTAYDIMSMTKQFTAAAILKLQMQGKLAVTDPISTYVGDGPRRQARDHGAAPADAHLWAWSKSSAATTSH